MSCILRTQLRFGLWTLERVIIARKSIQANRCMVLTSSGTWGQVLSTWITALLLFAANLSGMPAFCCEMVLNQTWHRERISLSALRHRKARCAFGNPAGGDCGPKGIHEIRRRRRDGIGGGEAADVSGPVRHAASRSRARKFQSGFHAADCARDSGTHAYANHQHHWLQRDVSGSG